MRARVVSWTLVTAAVLAGAACSNAPLSKQGPAPAVRTAAPEPPPAVRIALPKTALSQDQQITHTLNRLGYGPRPGDVERVRQMGLARWIERQLEPGRIPDDRVETALQSFPTLTMPVPELVRAYPEPRSEGRRQAPVRADEPGRDADHGAAREAAVSDRRRAPGRQADPCRDLRAPARRGHDGFLVQPLQRGRPQGRGEMDGRRLRAHGDPSARARQVP